MFLNKSSSACGSVNRTQAVRSRNIQTRSWLYCNEIRGLFITSGTALETAGPLAVSFIYSLYKEVVRDPRCYPRTLTGVARPCFLWESESIVHYLVNHSASPPRYRYRAMTYWTLNRHCAHCAESAVLSEQPKTHTGSVK